MTTNVKIRSHKTRVIRAIFREIVVKARKETTYPNKSKSEIGKILIGYCNCMRVWSTQIKKYAIMM